MGLGKAPRVKCDVEGKRLSDEREIESVCRERPFANASLSHDDDDVRP